MGFVPTHDAKDNTTKVLHLLHVGNKSQIQYVFINTDAEKAFDRVHWNFMLSVLRYGGFGNKMLQWIASIYSCPMAQVQANGVLSEAFQISNGTCQGCPLSPLLFALSLEPFLCTIRSNQDITGVKVGEAQYKISVHADNMMFSLTNPLITIPNLMKEFEKYSSLSNLHINFTKSEAMGVNCPQTSIKQLKQNLKFKWMDKALTYLGMLFASNIGKIFGLNFPPLLQRVKILLDKWKSGLHSWLEHCNIVKMSILPKFLYLLQALPIRIPTTYLKQCQKLIFDFIWAYKKPWLRRSQLILPKRQGGLAVPDIREYYQAIHLSRVVDWNRHIDFKLWVQMEYPQSSVLLGRASWCLAHISKELIKHLLIGNTLKICAIMLPIIGIIPETSPLYPILGNSLFPPEIEDRAFKHQIWAVHKFPATKKGGHGRQSRR